jgi:hypothetical protein
MPSDTAPSGCSAARDFRALLAGEPCWDVHARVRVGPLRLFPDDGILQNREELIAFCEWIATHHIRSYLEIGVWTGQLASALHRLFAFDLLATADVGHAAGVGLSVRLPQETRAFWGSSTSPQFRDWRATLGPIDLVFIDADHSYEGVRADFEINRALPHRFLAFHDIAGTDPDTRGVRQLWDELDGFKHEIVRPQIEAGPGAGLMGIGIWSATESPE